MKRAPGKLRNIIFKWILQRPMRVNEMLTIQTSNIKYVFIHVWGSSLQTDDFACEKEMFSFSQQCNIALLSTALVLLIKKVRILLSPQRPHYVLI